LKNQELTEMIIREVMKRLANHGQKALAVFTGGTAGFEEAVGQLNTMRNHGWNISILFTFSAEMIYGRDFLQHHLEGYPLYFENSLDRSLDLLQDTDKILLPVLTMNTAVKIALGISDTPATHLISNALLEGIPVIAAGDACNPRLYMQKRSRRGAEQYMKKLEDYLKTLEDYGIKIVPCANLYEAVAPEKPSVQSENREAKRRVITKEDILQAKRDGSMKIVLDSNSKVTPYAEETAGELGVEILCI